MKPSARLNFRGFSLMMREGIYFNLSNRIKCGDMASPNFNPIPRVSLFFVTLPSAAIDLQTQVEWWGLIRLRRERKREML